jgi:type VI secretion system secreted protein VgrG
MNYHLTLSPPLWRAGLRRNFRIFQQQDIQAISATLLSENGITDWTRLFMKPILPASSAYSMAKATSPFSPGCGLRKAFSILTGALRPGPRRRWCSVMMWPVSPRSASCPLIRTPAAKSPRNASVSSATGRRSAPPPWRTRITPLKPRLARLVQPPRCTPQRPAHSVRNLRLSGALQGRAARTGFCPLPGEGFRHDAETAAGVSNSAKLWPGKRFTLTGHPSLTLNREWQVTACVLRGSSLRLSMADRGREPR